VNGGVFNLVDDYNNCPAVKPDTGEACVMIAGFNAKAFDYPEADSKCTCDNGDLSWACVGKNVSNGIPASRIRKSSR